MVLSELLCTRATEYATCMNFEEFEVQLSVFRKKANSSLLVRTRWEPKADRLAAAEHLHAFGSESQNHRPGNIDVVVADHLRPIHRSWQVQIVLIRPEVVEWWLIAKEHHIKSALFCSVEDDFVRFQLSIGV